MVQFITNAILIAVGLAIYNIAKFFVLKLIKK
ncbi:hypothetical protein J2Z60_001184 [Lactobacillus colini]|uniref:Uncharacterized protein n=1 Tax=Lactobacillus colini TaxID=1819254 RepID=A0ABS4MF56_9LACO|nr:hypothetical protein [Lactobacillus colini]